MIANATSSIATNLEPNTAQSNMASAQKSPQPTRQKAESRTSSNSSPKINAPRDHRPKYDQDEPIYETNKKLPQIPSRPEQMRSPLSRNTSYRSRSPDSPADDPNKIDPLQYTALVDTNQALKIELQRLSTFETKCKQLEREASNANALKETNLNLESRVQQLADCEARCQRLEAEMNNMKTRSDILTDENISLHNKIKDMDRTIEHNEQSLWELRDKEGLLRKEIELAHSSNDLNEQKIGSLEQANQILESEMEALRAQQRSERDKLKQKMQLLNSKQAERLKKIEQEKNSLETELNTLRSGVQASDDMHKELVTLKDLNLKYEDEIDYLRQQLAEKKCELENVMKQRDADTHNYLEKLKILNDENLSLCNQFSSNSMSKDEELNKLSQKLAHAEQELSSANGQIASLEKELAARHSEAEIMEKKVCRIQSLEKECADLALTNGKNEELIKSLRCENENLRHELDESKASRDQLEHRLTDQTLKSESLAADLALRHIELGKIESYKSKCANLERELDELKRLKGDRVNDFDSRSRKLSESSEKYEYEMKILNAQMYSLVSVCHFFSFKSKEFDQ
ncbi:hypothetical protein BpHYR1_015548 [Brachionus plicatilis]|uniref:Uncharacterized protein n=1 Tax=Brachionus plicatilis TaxID=10195 RepID=A0A3M7RA47_BRAPC|nr:hypothetical protein BpHYR1_015548 [Brachionus plicatilis]